MKVLIVDEAKNQDAIIKMLPSDCEVTVIGTYREAVVKISAEKFDGLIVPLRLQKLIGTTPNGFLLVLHALTRGIKRIALIETVSDWDELTQDFEFLLEHNQELGWCSSFYLNETQLVLRRIPRNKEGNVDWRRAYDLISHG